MIHPFKRLIIALAFVAPVAALAASPVMAASHPKTKTHHNSVHKASAHKGHGKKAVSPTAS